MSTQSIAEQLLHVTVRIDTESVAGRHGSGTGFIFTYKQGNDVIPVIVTNRHVVSERSFGTITFMIRDGKLPKLGHKYPFHIRDFSRAWFPHPDPEVDVVVMPFTPILERLRASNVDIFYRAITREITPGPQQLYDLDALEDLVFVGYPNGIWDEQNLLPVMRRGITATPIFVDFGGKPIFLMDGSVFPGSSGSPVFVYNPGMWYSKTGTTHVGTRLLFVGVVAAVYFREDMNDIITMPVPAQNEKQFVLSSEMIDLAIVFKTETIVETIKALARSRGIDL